MKIRILILTLMFVHILSAYCPMVFKEIYAPAVINENSSQMIKVSMYIRSNLSTEGGENVYYSLNPVIGVETQKSILIANDIARKIAEKNGINTSECDVIIKVSNENGVSYIEGPSAGALFTVVILSGFENKNLRSDTTMTGTIEQDGRIGSVGGLPLKAEAAYKLGFKRIIFPLMDNSEKIELLMFKRYYNITVLQAKEIEEAYKFMTSETNYPENLSLSPEKTEFFNTTNFTHRYADWINKVTKEMISDAERGMNLTQMEYKENFESRLQNSKNAFIANHYYTAANIAFLLSIDKEVALFSKERLFNEYKETKECLNKFEENDEKIRNNLNNENFQVIGPAETRYFWAKVKLNQTIDEKEIFNIATKNQTSEFISPLLSKYKDIVNAKYWCLAANHMIQNIEDYKLENYTISENSNKFDKFEENKLNVYVKNVLDGLEIDEQNTDAVFRMQSAKAAFEEGKYLSALVDAAYIKSYSDIEALAFDNNSQEKILSKLNSSLEKEYKYIWPIIFRNHAKEISKTDKISALRIALIAENLENYYSDAERIGISNNNSEDVNELVIGENENESINEKIELIQAYQITSLITFIAGVVFVAFVILFLIGKVKRMKPNRKIMIKKKYR